MKTNNLGSKEYTLDIQFHPEQLKWLEKMFPEVHFPHDVSTEQLRHYNGQRSVISAIRAKTRSR